MTQKAAMFLDAGFVATTAKPFLNAQDKAKNNKTANICHQNQRAWRDSNSQP
jgi:hypothetical protein